MRTDDELLQEALELLETCRCRYTDPGVRVRWGQKKNRLMREIRERLAVQ